MLKSGGDQDRKDVNYSFLSAVREGRLEKTRELINTYGLSYSPEWVEGYYLLCDAVKNKHAAVAKLLLTSGCRVNNINNINTPLHFAVRNGDIEIVKMILDKGANIDAKDTNCQTPLHLAVSCGGDIEIVKMILDKGANIDATNYYGRTLLHDAIINKNKEVTELLLKHKADVNVGDNDGTTPLHVAAMIGCKEIVEALLQHDADIHSTDDNEKTALHYAALSESNFLRGNPNVSFHNNIREEIVKLLLIKGANVDAQTKDGVTTLHYAIEEGYAKVVEALLEYNANVDFGVNTPLHLSAQNGHKEISIMLLNKGANVNAKQEDGTTALHIATQNGYKEVVKVLLECGADINSRDEYGRTALHIASEEGHYEFVKVFLECGAEINCRDEGGKTALYLASGEGNDEVVKTLLEYGADINITSNDNITPLDHVIADLRSFYRQINRYPDDVDFSYSDRDNPSCEVTAKTLIRHIVKMKTAYVSENNLLSMRSSELIGFKDECKKEIASMKREKINNLNTSFYDILAKGTSSLVIYMKNENIVQVLKSEDYKTKFPIYAKMIESNFRKGMERKELLEPSYKIYHFLFRNFPQLPYNCTEKIFSYLSDADLRILMDACRPLGICDPRTNINDAI